MAPRLSTLNVSPETLVILKRIAYELAARRKLRRKYLSMDDVVIYLLEDFANKETHDV